MSFGKSFLESPDLFPARNSGEPWSDRQVLMDFAGGPYRFSGLSPAQAELVRRRFGEACRQAAPGVTPTVETSVYRVREGEFRRVELAGWEYTFDLEHQPSAVRIAGRLMMARLEWQPGLVGALWTSTEAREDFAGLFENYLRFVVAYRLLDCGGALLHSAAVVDNGCAYLFLGSSGAGKSTLARLSLETGRAVLSDDLNALRRSNGQTVVEQIPFTGDLEWSAAPGTIYPLQAAYYLRKGIEHQLEDLGSAEALASLIACAPYVNNDPYRAGELFSNLKSLIRELSVRSLTFTRDSGFWDRLLFEVPATAA